MRYYSTTFWGLAFLIGTQTTFAVASESSDSSLISPVDYSNNERSLQTGANCKSSVSATCTLGSGGIPCDDNLLVKRSDCKANNNKIAVPVTITWRYCNDGPTDQLPDGNLLAPMFRKKIKNDPLRNSILPANTCREVVSKPSINVCKPGAVMSMKYVGSIPSVTGSYCYAYAFRRVRKKWLPEGDCALTTSIECKMKAGSKFAGENCAGNIINKGKNSCDVVPVMFKYQICLWNYGAGGESSMVFKKAASYVKFNGEMVRPSFQKNKLTRTDRCREVDIPQEIDSCSDKAFSIIQVRGSLDVDDAIPCKSFTNLAVTPAVECDFNFIITEIASNKDGGTFVELYSPKCKNSIITKEYAITRYNGAKKQPSAESVRLKGQATDENGFITICMQKKQMLKVYGKGSCDVEGGPKTAADMRGTDNIALIEGRVTGSYTILDIYGKPGTSNSGTSWAFTNARAVRYKNAMNPNPVWNKYQWFVSVKQGDPGGWDTGKATFHPTASPNGGGGGGGKNPAPTSGGGGKNPAPTSGGGGKNPAPTSDGGGKNPAPTSDGGGKNPAPTSDGGGKNPAPTSDGGGKNPAPTNSRPTDGNGKNPAPTNGGGGGGGKNPAPTSGGGGGKNPAPTSSGGGGGDGGKNTERIRSPTVSPTVMLIR